jgi:phage-related protein (TIGR01555 family)
MARKLQNTSRVRRLQRELMSLRQQAQELRNTAESAEDRLSNSFGTLIQGMSQGGSELNNFETVINNTGYNLITVQYMALGYLYKSEGIIQAAIDMPVQDAFRGGLELISHTDMMDKDDIKALSDELDESSFFKTVKTAFDWARLYGGAALIIENGENPQKPLTMQGMANRPMKLIAAHRWELTSSERYPMGGFYTFYGQKVHVSRVKTISGKEAPYPINVMLQGWGMSEVEHIVQPLNIFLRTQNVVYDLLKEAKVDVFRLKGFTAQLASNKGTQQVLQRLNISNRAKSTNNALVMDAEDEYDQKQLTYAGLADIWKENRIGLSCNLRIPMTKLFGISAAGFNSGEDDIENYIGMVESEVREEAKPTLRELLRLKCLSLFGDEYDLMSKFYPLRTMTAVEEETVKTSKHARWKDDAASGYLTPEEYMDLQQKEGLVPIESEVSQGADPEPPMAAMGMNEDDDSSDDQGGKEDGARNHYSAV